MKTITLLIASAALCGSAFSQTVITQTQSFTGIPDFSAPLLFNKYSGNPSALLGINISYSITIEGGQFIVDNDSPTPATTTASFGADLTATSTDVALINASLQPIIQGVAVTNTQTFNLAADNGDGVGNYDSTDPDGGILVGTTKTTSGSGSVSPLAFAGYIGSGQFTVNAVSKQIGSLSFNSGIETASTPVSASGTVTVTYIVPEPSSALLLGLGALGFALRRRRI